MQHKPKLHHEGRFSEFHVQRIDLERLFGAKF